MPLFGFGIKEEESKPRTEKHSAYVQKYNKKLEEYDKLLQTYHEGIDKMDHMIHEYEAKDCSNQLDSVQTALDLKYLKEQGDQFQEQLMDLTDSHIAEMKHSLETIRNKIEDLNSKDEEHEEVYQEIITKLRKQKKLTYHLFLLLILNTAGIVVLILRMLEII